MFRKLGMLALLLAVWHGEARAEGPLKVGVFAVDASPPIGSPMAYDPTKGVVHPLELPGRRPDRRGRADRALRGRLDRDRQRRPGRVPQGAGRGGRHDRGAGRASTRCTSTTPRTATSRPTACSPRRGSTARSSTPTSPAT